MTETPVLTQQQKADIKDEFRRRRRRQLLATVPLLAIIGVSFWLRRDPAATLAGQRLAALVPVALVVIVGFVVFTLVNWRCPACKSYLGKGIGPSFCRKCGVALE